MLPKGKHNSKNFTVLIHLIFAIGYDDPVTEQAQRLNDSSEVTLDNK